MSDFIHENLFRKILDISFNSRYINKKLVNKGMQQVKELFDNDPFAVDGIYNYETSEEVLVQLSDPSTFECNRVKKSRQYYFQVIG